MESLKEYIRDVPGFPHAGILYRDITPLLASRQALEQVVEAMCAAFASQPVDQVVGVESRGFLFGPLVALRQGAGFVPARKQGRLPRATVQAEYSLEYGVGQLEIHKDAIAPGDRVVVIDDLLATGGTMGAACQLVEELGGQVVACAALIELCALDGRKHKQLRERRLHTLIKYP